MFLELGNSLYMYPSVQHDYLTPVCRFHGSRLARSLRSRYASLQHPAATTNSTPVTRSDIDGRGIDPSGRCCADDETGRTGRRRMGLDRGCDMADFTWRPRGLLPPSRPPLDGMAALPSRVVSRMKALILLLRWSSRSPRTPPQIGPRAPGDDDHHLERGELRLLLSQCIMGAPAGKGTKALVEKMYTFPALRQSRWKSTATSLGVRECGVRVSRSPGGGCQWSRSALECPMRAMSGTVFTT
ncbi:hypothetical protein B0H17DRAFT_404017 [Mycena rosella]|uniref:Uncharacterized protein n=1 Tax=Mycena rosella TaxID=1033263 RepID=A0AAD7G0B3_MYCRO|nr:hypothetical protein B0H17DRAFT_404017 [Mycena rosella]